MCEKLYGDVRVCLNLLKLQSFRRYIVAMALKVRCSAVYRSVRKIAESDSHHRRICLFALSACPSILPNEATLFLPDGY